MDLPIITAYPAERLLPAPSRVEWVGSTDTPADTLAVEFAVGERYPSFLSVRMALPDGSAWEGLVDEQHTRTAPGGMTLTLYARRKIAALLLDNEAIPKEYDQPSLAELVRLHGQAFGLRGVLADVRHPGRFSIEKGMSIWAVLERFCVDVLGTRPGITTDNFLDTRCQQERRAVFSNRGGIAYRYADVIEKPCERISEILCRTQGQGGYLLAVENPHAAAAGVRARRLSYDEAYPDWQRRRVPIQRLREGERDSYEIRLRTALPVACKPGDCAGFDGGPLGRTENLVVSQHKLLWSDSAAYSEIWLQKKEAFLCG